MMSLSRNTCDWTALWPAPKINSTASAPSRTVCKRAPSPAFSKVRTKKATSSGLSSTSRIAGVSLAMSVIIPDGKIKRRAFVPFGLRPDLAAVPVKDALHDGEPDPGALKFVRPVQALENGKELVCILHIKSRAIVLHEIGPLHIVPTDGHHRFIPVSGIFQRIGNQIGEDLVQQCGVGPTLG